MTIVEFPKIIIRHSPPTKLDHAQRGTKCHVLREFQERPDLYIQVSTNEEDPIWEYSGLADLEN